MVESKTPGNITTYEAQYVASTVGQALSEGIAEVVEIRPFDPIEYLAQYLYKFAENKARERQDEETKKEIEKLIIEQKEEEERQEERRKESEAIKLMEEKERKEKEALERKKREAEELAKRKEDIANIPPALPAVLEEEDNVVEFGETQLHQLAAVAGSNLLTLLRENGLSLAARNSQFLTARDVAEQNNLPENVKQIDDFILELVSQEETKIIDDLVLNGYKSIIPVVEANLGNAEQMETKDMKAQAEHIFTFIPELQQKIKQIIDSIEKNDLKLLKVLLDRKVLAFFRTETGKSSIHLAIEKNYFDIALFLIEKSPSLSKVNDCQGNYAIDSLNAIDRSILDAENQSKYDKLSELLKL